jgi:hypothetical protein
MVSSLASTGSADQQLGREGMRKFVPHLRPLLRLWSFWAVIAITAVWLFLRGDTWCYVVVGDRTVGVVLYAGHLCFLESSNRLVDPPARWAVGHAPGVLVFATWNARMSDVASFEHLGLVRHNRYFPKGLFVVSGSTGMLFSAGFARTLIVPHWLTFLVTSLWFGRSALRIARRQRAADRMKRQLCIKCGYDLRATPERCPECGATNPSLSRPTEASSVGFD